MRKNAKSLRKSSPKKTTLKKDCSKICVKKEINTLNIQNSLYRKYSTSQNYYYVSIVDQQVDLQQMNIKTIETNSTKECLQKYYKGISRKHAFPRIKQVYKMHKQIPRFFQPGIRQILEKCHHRKRLLEYFKIAKILGIKIQSVKFSTFLMSVNDMTNNIMQKCKKYDPIITKISSIDFSQDFQKQLIYELNGIENVHMLSNISSQKFKSNSTSFE